MPPIVFELSHVHSSETRPVSKPTSGLVLHLGYILVHMSCEVSVRLDVFDSQSIRESWACVPFSALTA